MWTISQLVSQTASMKLRSSVALLLLLATSVGLAQVWEAVSGSVIIGRPLDIVVQSRQGSGELDSIGCVRAEVRYGETLLPVNEVRVGLAERQEADGRSLQGYRVQTLRPLDEPYVVLSVIVGCGRGAGTFRREWTLLASLGPDDGSVPVLSSARPDDGFVASNGHDARSGSRTSGGGASGGEGGGEAPAVAPRSVQAVRGHHKRPSPLAVARPSSGVPLESRFSWSVDASRITSTAPGPTAMDRLWLDVADLSEFDVLLARMIARDLGLVVEPPTSSASPSEVDDWRQRLEASQAERDQLRREVTELRVQLAAEKTDGQLARMVATVAVGAMLVLGGGILWWRRRRQPAPRPWWLSGDAASAFRAEEYPTGVSEVPFIDTPEQRGKIDAGDRDERQDRDVRHTEENTGKAPDLAVGNGEPAVPTESGTENLSGASVVSDHAAVLRVDALWSLWQIVDFWVALGQVSEAVTALRAHARQHPEGGAWPLLRWAALARQFHLAGDEAAAGAAYMEAFGHPMSMAALEPDAPGVADDPDLLSRLMHVWPSPAASSTVATALLAAPSGHDAKGGRSLPWYEDLLILWAILRMRAQQPEEGNTRLTMAEADRS